MKKLSLSSVKPFKHTAKLSGPVEVSIRHQGEWSMEHPNRVRGLIQSSADLDQIEFEWSFPEQDMLHTAGSKTGVIYDVKAGKVYETTIDLQPAINQNQKVFFYGRVDHGGTKASHYDLFNTTQEENIKAAKQRLLDRSTDYAKDKLKVFN